MKDSTSDRHDNDGARTKLALGSQFLLMTSPELAFYGISSSLSIVFASPSCKGMFGIEPDEAVGRNALDPVHPEDRDRLLQAAEDAESCEGTASVEFRVFRLDGAPMWVHATVYHAADELDVLDLRLLCLARDITESKLTEQIVGVGSRLDHLMSEARSIDDLLSGVPAEIQRLDGTICCGIHLHDAPSNNQLIHCAQSVGEACPRFLRRVGAGPEVAERVKNGEAAVVDLWSEGRQDAIEASLTARSFVAVPVCHGCKVLGSLLMASRYGVEYMRSQVDLLMNLASRIGAEVTRLRVSGSSVGGPEDTHAWSIWRLKEGRLALAEYNELANALTLSTLRGLIGRDADSLLAHCPQLLRKMYYCLATGAEQRFHDWYHFQQCDRDPRILRVNISRVDPVSIQVTAVDVTEQALAEMSRQDHEHLSHVLLDSFRAYAALLSPEGHILVINRAFADTCGVKPDAVAGKAISELIPEDLWKLLRGPIANSWRMNTVVSFSCRWNERSLEWRLTPISKGGPGKARLAVVGRDVSERVAALAAIEASEQRYRLLAENARDLISLHDEDGICLYASPGSLRVLGYDASLLRGTNPYDLIHPGDRRRVSDAQDALLESGGNRSIEYRVRNSCGEYVWVEATAHEVPYRADEGRRFVCVTRDISRRKQIEEELRLAIEQLEVKHIALTEVLNRFEEEKRSVSAACADQIRGQVLPIVDQLKRVASESMNEDIRLLERAIRQATRTGTDSIGARLAGLTQREIDVCLLIRDGRSSKEIAAQLHVSPLTINKHRETIRRKLGLQHQRVNLRSYLRQLSI